MARSKTTTKTDIIRKISVKTGIPHDQIKSVVEQFFTEVCGELVVGRRLEFREFGVFKPTMRRGRSARNPKTGETFAVPDAVIARFVPGRLLKERLLAVDPSVINDGKHRKKAVS